VTKLFYTEPTWPPGKWAPYQVTPTLTLTLTLTWPPGKSAPTRRATRAQAQPHAASDALPCVCSTRCGSTARGPSGTSGRRSIRTTASAPPRELCATCSILWRTLGWCFLPYFCLVVPWCGYVRSARSAFPKDKQQGGSTNAKLPYRVLGCTVEPL